MAPATKSHHLKMVDMGTCLLGPFGFVAADWAAKTACAIAALSSGFMSLSV